MHCSCDASERAFGAVIYFSCIKDDEVKRTFIISKGLNVVLHWIKSFNSWKPFMSFRGSRNTVFDQSHRLEAQDCPGQNNSADRPTRETFAYRSRTRDIPVW
ncbi:hypothetical protein NPIL_693971 [Nephila pilipes]|uniref:Uncharacterized protein n=1 Tax=Nephila pilipes TaxID=299642 RepID=A0A8X6PAI1_NEPPI|nr:hypothetical protein NPIL_693971 [Nephila pilipes]